VYSSWSMVGMIESMGGGADRIMYTLNKAAPRQVASVRSMMYQSLSLALTPRRLKPTGNSEGSIYP